MFTGKTNIATGFLFLTMLMLCDFSLIFLRDFTPGKEQRLAGFAFGKHFEPHLAHAHGNLFALINIAVGLALLRLPVTAVSTRLISGLALAGMLMPLGIFSQGLLGASPIFVLGGGLAMVLSMGCLAFTAWQAGIRP
mgnify:CR=1 FL=1